MLTAIPVPPSGQETPAGLRADYFVLVGAFLLAILPVRVVLVPTDVSGLTLVDYVLGAEMSLIVSATLLVATSARIPTIPSRSELRSTVRSRATKICAKLCWCQRTLGSSCDCRDAGHRNL